MRPEASGDLLITLAAEGATWFDCLPDGVFDELCVAWADNGHGHPTGVTSVVDGRRGGVAKMAWSVPCPSSAGRCRLAGLWWLIWRNVGSNLLPRAVLDVVEDGDVFGSPRGSHGWD